MNAFCTRRTRQHRTIILHHYCFWIVAVSSSPTPLPPTHAHGFAHDFTHVQCEPTICQRWRRCAPAAARDINCSRDKIRRPVEIWRWRLRSKVGIFQPARRADKPRSGALNDHVGGDPNTPRRPKWEKFCRHERLPRLESVSIFLPYDDIYGRERVAMRSAVPLIMRFATVGLRAGGNLQAMSENRYH